MRPGGPARNGNGKGDGAGHAKIPNKEEPAPGAGFFGMALFLLSLGILFLGSVVAYVVIRVRADAWPPTGLPDPPPSLWASSFLILAGSATIQSALNGIRDNRQELLRVALTLTVVIGLAFLVSQGVTWVEMARAAATIDSSLYGYLFYFLTGLHAVHVLAGLVPLFVITVNAFYGRYSALRYDGVRYCTMYWHFLGGVWLTIFALLVLAV